MIFRFTFVLLFGSTMCLGQGNDIRVLRSIHTARNPQLDPTFTFITHTTAPITIATPTLVCGVAYLRHDTVNFRKGLTIGASLATSVAVTLAVKYLVARPRPFERYPEHVEGLTDVYTPSFPSGHSSNAFSTATSLTLAYPKWFVAAPAFTWATAVGYSRMHLGVHYPSDVLVGAAIGAGSAWLTHFLNKRLFQR